MLTTLKWKKQDTVAYMQYDLNYEIILIFIHRKKDCKKMHQTFNCMWDHKILIFFFYFLEIFKYSKKFISQKKRKLNSDIKLFHNYQ